MPDSDMLVLKVEPDAMEGAGKVRVMDADPALPHFAHATFRPEKAETSRFMDN